MICNHCRDAGFLNRTADDEPAQNAVAYHHAKCPGGTWCDCQHKTQGVNRKLTEVPK